MCRNNEQYTTSKEETWSRGANSCLPFDVNVMLDLSNSFTLSLAHCIVCSITAGNDLSVQWGTSSSGGSRLKRDTHKMIPNNQNKKSNNAVSFWVGSDMDD